MKLLPTLVLPALGLIASCAFTPTAEDAVAADIEVLTGWMTGTFSSEAQAAADPENFLEIRLVMLPIWTERADGPWLYVEQAALSALEQPYRQRVYRLRPGVAPTDAAILSEVYLLPGDPLEQAAAWTSEGPLDGIVPGDLVLRDGCTIGLNGIREEDVLTAFIGATHGSGCTSRLADAAYATSEVNIGPALLESWDRGFDEAGGQAWGATEGPYEFLKLSDGPPAE